MKKLSLDTAEILALQFRVKKLGVGEREPINIKSALRKLNILTLYKPLSSAWYGLCLKSPSGDCFMLINSQTTRGRQHYTVAHELFHLFYDEHLNSHICEDGSSAKSVSEINADIFASALLMPRNGVLEFLSSNDSAQKDMSLATIIKMEQYFSVSRSSLLYRLKAIGVLNDANFKRQLEVPVQKSAKQYGYDLSLYKPGNENLVIGDFGEKARLLYDSGKISEGQYLELLNLISNDKD